MASAIIIPIIIVAILGLGGYLIYRYALFDAMCKSSINRTLKKYNIRKTPFEIVQEFYKKRGEALSDKEIRELEKKYRQTDPDEFLTMYDSIREDQKSKQD